MIKPYQETWRELESAALRVLEKPELFDDGLVRTELVRTIRVWHYPSFEPYISWHLFMPIPRGSTLPATVIKAIWDQRGDRERFYNPLVGVKHEYKLTSRPTIEMQTGSLDSAQVRMLVQEASLLTVSLAVEEGGVTIDGSVFGVELNANGTKCEFEWNNPERPWADLTKFVERVFAIGHTSLGR